MRRYWADMMAVCGLSCIAGAGYVVDTALGLFATGVALIVAYVAIEMGGDDVA